jgi:predicted amino acid dehydrogenase
MITKEMFKQALETSHNSCDTPEGCIHAEAAADNSDAMMERVIDAVMGAKDTGASPGLGIFYMGLHVGYRLRQLELEPVPQDRVN